MEAKAFAFFSHVFNSVSKCGRVSLLFSMNCKASACAVFAYEWLKWICVLLRGFGLGQFTNRKSNLPRYFPYSYRFVFFGHFLEFSGLEEEVVFILGFLTEQEVPRSILIEHANGIVHLDVEMVEHA